MTVLDPITRGDSRTILIDQLLDADDDPTTFGAGDVIRFTIRAEPGGTPLVAVSSDGADPAITFTPGTDTATIGLRPDDWEIDRLARDTACVWDVEVTVDADNVFTLDWGTVTVIADITR